MRMHGAPNILSHGAGHATQTGELHATPADADTQTGTRIESVASFCSGWLVGTWGAHADARVVCTVRVCVCMSVCK